MLGTSFSISAQNEKSTVFNLLDDVPSAEDSGADQDKDKKQDTQVIITADKLQDEQPVGPYRRPKWTLQRISPQTRIYLQVDPGEVQFEQWLDIRIRKKRSEPDDRIRMSEEFEFGLGGRFQLDLYANSIFTRNGQNSTLAIRSWAAELRYALADWGVIWGNPTLYLEYILWNNQPDGKGDAATSSIEPKLLLGDELGRGWYWGANFFYEGTTNDSVREYGATGSLIHTIVDGKLSAGLTARFVYGVEEVTGGIKERTRELYLGPSFQIRMAHVETEMEVNGVKTKVSRSKAHFDIEPIFGLTGNSDRAQVLLVFGWVF
jgi:hypothetical protein